MGTANRKTFSDKTEGVTFASSISEIEANDESLTIKGLALPFNEVYDSPFGAITFDRKAFDVTLEEIREGKNHAFLAADGHELDAMFLLARSDKDTGEGSLRFRVTDEGLEFKAEIIKDFVGEAVYRRIELGILDGVSVGVSLEEYAEDDDGNMTYQEVGLREISLVSYPAFKETWCAPETAQLKEATNMKPNVNVNVRNDFGETPGSMDELKETIAGLSDQLRALSETMADRHEQVADETDEVLEELKDEGDVVNIAKYFNQEVGQGDTNKDDGEATPSFADFYRKEVK